jgi:septum formation inhibitor MinC
LIKLQAWGRQFNKIKSKQNKGQTMNLQERINERLEQAQATFNKYDLIEPTQEQEQKRDQAEQIIQELETDLELLEEVSIDTDSEHDYKIAIEDWGLYNEGFLSCKWWDHNATLEEIETYYKLHRKYFASCCDSEEVELFIADSETPFKCSEHDSIEETLYKLSEAEELEEDDLDKINFLIDEVGLSWNEALHDMEDVIIWENSDMEDVAREFIDSCYNLDDMMGSLSSYFDYEALGRDMKMDGNYYEIGSDIFEYRR